MPLISAGNNAFGLTPGNLLGRATTKVFAKKRWDDAWEETPLIALNASTKAFPGRSTCTLQIDTGEVKRPDDAVYVAHQEQHDDEDLWVDHFVCVVVFPEDGIPYALWCGYLPQQRVDVEGVKGGVDAQGNFILEFATSIVLTAFGLDYLLERRQIDGAYIWSSSGNADRIRRQPTFNERARGGTTLAGNSTGFVVPSPAQPGGPDVSEAWVFGDDGVRWNTQRIIDYLLFFSQNDINPSDSPHFRLSGDVFILSFLASIEPVLRQDLQNVRALITKLIDRKRGIGVVVRWQFIEQGDMFLPGGDVDLHVYSNARNTGQVGDVVLPQNFVLADLDFGRKLGIQPVVKLDSLATYDEIVIQGERVRSMFTVGVFGSSLGFPTINPAWITAQETAYKQANDLGRKSDVHASVFRTFQIPFFFPWNDTRFPDGRFSPVLDDDGNVDFTQGAAQFSAYVKILNSLPVPRRGDISGKPRHPGPFAVLSIPDALDPGLPSGRYVFADATPNQDIGEYTAGRVTPHDRDGMIDVRFAPNHILALGTFDPAGDVATLLQPSDTVPVFDNRDMLLTVAVELDQHAAVHVTTGAPGDYGHKRRLVIRVADAHLWIVGPSVVDGLNEDESLHFYQGQRIVRDDTDRLRAIAGLAKIWYGQRRRTVDAVEDGIFEPMPIGTMIDKIAMEGAQKDVHTVVSEQRWDFENGTTAIATGYSELDLSAF